MKNLHQQVLELLPQCIEDRRWLHRHAELSFREYKTADYLEQALCELEGLELSRPTPTSVMAVLRTGRPGRCLAIRADIDALPIREENELDYRSCNEGVMHACGHDGHAAILLNSVRLLCRRREELCGELRFIFQHAEETPPGGAVEVIRAGVLKGVDEVFGLHLTSTLPTGSFGVCSGVLTSATDRFEIEITGRGGTFQHAAGMHRPYCDRRTDHPCAADRAFPLASAQRPGGALGMPGPFRLGLQYYTRQHAFDRLGAQLR